MQKKGYAYFVNRPRRITDLQVLHAFDQESPYEIVAEIALPAIDYDNFINDLTVDRAFIENNALLCENGEIKKCLYVHGQNSNTGILVIPEDACWVGWAAIMNEKGKPEPHSP